MIQESPDKNSRGYIVWAGLSFFLPLALLYAYSFWSEPLSIFGFELKKLVPQEATINMDDIKPILADLPKKSEQPVKISQADSSKNSNGIDTQWMNKKYPEFNISDAYPIYDSLQNSNLYSDSISHRVLIMGDSECGGLCFQLNDYCLENGHKLVASLVWNSASIYNYAYSDTVVKVIKKYQPTYIFIVIGLNELHVRDLEKRRAAAQILAKKIEGIPYTWIGPANFREDFGINQVFKESAEPGTFFLSKYLNLPKGGDNRHPNKTGYRIWMDTLAIWLQTEAKYKIRMNQPVTRNRSYKAKIINLNAARYRGY